MNLLFASPGIDTSVLSTETLRSLVPFCRQARMQATEVVKALDDDTVLRIVPMDASLSGCVTIFVESFNHREPIFDAAKAFGLTNRETEALRLLALGKSSPEIAQSLYISEGTAADHVKSIMRKMGCSKRAEVIAKVFRPREDMASAPIEEGA